MCEGIKEQVAELSDLAASSGQKAALRHTYASPPPGAEWGAEDWTAYWDMYEKAMGLEGCPYSEQVHDKPGEDDRPPHRHRVYLALTKRGTLVRLGHDYARQEAASRIAEHDTGAAFVKGAHNVRAARIASELGREDVAMAMASAGLLDGTRARSSLSPRDRLIQERTNVEKADVARWTATAWAANERGMPLTEALSAHGLRLAWGDKKNVPVVVDQAGTAHGLAQMLRMAARESGGKAPNPEAIAVRLDGMAVPPVADVRREIRAERSEPAAPLHDHELAAPTLDGAVPGSEQAAPFSEPPVSASVTPVAAPASKAMAPAAAPARDAPQTLAGGVGGVSLEDVGTGPGEPPGPGASPDERAKWLERLTAYEDRKAAAWARWVASLNAHDRKKEPAAKSGGEHGYGDIQQNVQQVKKADEAIRRLLNDFALQWQRAASAAEILRAISKFEVDSGRDDRTAGISYPAHDGHDSANARVGRASSRDAVRTDNTTGHTGAEPDSGNRGDPGDRSREPAANRTATRSDATDARKVVARRAATRRLERGLAAAPEAMTALRRARAELNPQWRDRRDAHRRIRDDRQRIAAILATYPHPNPEDHDPEARATRYAGRLSDGSRERRTEAEAAQTVALEALAKRSVGTRLLAAVGISTHEQKRAVSLIETALLLTESAQQQKPTADEYKEARADGAAHAYAAQRSTRDWERKPDVAHAIEQDRLNRAADAAAASGDPAIRNALCQGDPEAARQVIRDREEQERRDREELERRQRLRQDHGRQEPGPGGPSGPKSR